MPTGRYLIALAGLLGAAAVIAAGCTDYVAEYYTPLTDPKLADGGTPANCDPTHTASPVADPCGVFVSSSNGSDTSGKGTKAAPYQTLGAALGAAKGKPVYACGEVFKEAVLLSAKVDLYGALDCTKGWAYDASKKTQLSADPDAVPMKLTSSAGGSTVHDFAITAVDAMAAGGSSIAVLDDHADVTLERVDLAAGTGRAGAAGMPQAQVMTPATANGSNGGDDATCNITTLIPGGPGGTNTCSGTKTDGGNGGKGIPDVNGGQGGDGQPTATPGNGGSGQTKTVACNVNDPKGIAGGVGMPGTGAHGIGEVSASGYQGAGGVLGAAGMPGQGGGGGGGARECDMAGMFAGPSGGGGGAGGCGGAAGSPGQSGGSSVGVLTLGAKLTLTTVTITTKGGGAGGLGGDGQPGGNGGLAGNAVGSAACNGGKGGQGGAGGPGGGGAGGHSIAVAIKGGTFPDLKGTTITHGSGGPGGGGGDMDMTPQTKGDAGLGCKTLDFSNPTSCVM